MNICPECGATHADNQTCNDDFNTMLGWETEDEARWEVHHLMVLSYHLQHPTIYSQQGLNGAVKMLAEFLETNISSQDVRKRDGERLNSSKRGYNITSRRGSYGAYAHPVNWTMRAADVVALGPDDYNANVKAWARSIYNELKTTDNLAPRPEPGTSPGQKLKPKQRNPQQKPLGKHWKPRHKS